MSVILITGTSGLAGRNLAAILSGAGDTVVGGDLNVDAIPSDDPLRDQTQLMELDVRKADRIVFLDDGEIKDIGNHTSLMADPDSPYRRFVELQGG